ncbi:putative indole-3-pyruvate monooxygenase YUCCA10 [Bidens hawaiensis]|uniref:putative indole-3-pyruvate monooxygenase YUCCA10 n=1 Tax=Bidens hawaiensis TaxID=980011 RepID=UPI00404A3CD5
MHSSEYENGKKFGDEKVLVVGAGNSGMEIAYALCNWGAQASIVIHSPLFYGDLGNYGTERLCKGSFWLKKETRWSPFIDIETIWSQIMLEIKDIKDDHIKFINGQERQFDAIVLAIGFKSTVHKWLKDDGGHFNEKGMPKLKSLNHWKGKRGLYCVGFASVGLFGPYPTSLTYTQSSVAGPGFDIERNSESDDSSTIGLPNGEHRKTSGQSGGRLSTDESLAVGVF